MKLFAWMFFGHLRLNCLTSDCLAFYQMLLPNFWICCNFFGSFVCAFFLALNIWPGPYIKLFFFFLVWNISTHNAHIAHNYWHAMQIYSENFEGNFKQQQKKNSQRVLIFCRRPSLTWKYIYIFWVIALIYKIAGEL